MKNLTYYEFKKNYNKRSVWIFLAIILITNLAYFFVFNLSWEDTYTLDETTNKIQKHSGLEAIKINKEIDNFFSGELTDEKINMMKQYFNENGEKEFLNSDENQLLKIKYNNQLAILKKFENDDGTLKDINEVFEEELLPLNLGYSKGWAEFIINFSNFFSLILCVFIIMCNAGVYVDENILCTDVVIYTTKRGRNELFQTKFLLAMTSSILIYTIFYLVNLFLYGVAYGFDGGMYDIQSNIIFVNSLYKINYWKMAVLMFVMGLLGSITITSIVLFFSYKFKSLTSIISCSMAIIYFPILFDLSEIFPGFQKILQIMPIFAMNIKETYKQTELYLGYKIQPILCILLCLIISTILFVNIRKGVKKYRITR